MHEHGSTLAALMLLLPLFQALWRRISGPSERPRLSARDEGMQ